VHDRVVVNGVPVDEVIYEYQPADTAEFGLCTDEFEVTGPRRITQRSAHVPQYHGRHREDPPAARLMRCAPLSLPRIDFR
jgi:hypothetical protein